jgi:YD repeat-containing protein
MAIQTVNIGLLTDVTDNSQATLDYDYDDASLQVTGVRIANGTNLSTFVRVIGTANNRTYQKTTAPHTTETVTIGSNQAARLQLTVTPSGKLDGVQVAEWHFV